MRRKGLGGKGGRTGVGIEFGVVEVLDDGGDGFDGAIPKQVAARDISTHTSSIGTLIDKIMATYILKFPPTKNFRAMIAAEDNVFRVEKDVLRFRQETREDSVIELCS